VTQEHAYANERFIRQVKRQITQLIFVVNITITNKPVVLC